VGPLTSQKRFRASQPMMFGSNLKIMLKNARDYASKTYTPFSSKRQFFALDMITKISYICTGSETV
jgi:hypothetical protein